MWKSGNWGQECDCLLHRVIALRERRNIKNAVFCEVSFGKNHALYIHLAYKDVDRFRNGTGHELSCFKACQISKIYPRSHERTNAACKSSDYENTDKNLWVLKNTSDVEKLKTRRKQNFEDEANNTQLDREDTQRSNLDSKYLRATLVLKYPYSFICFYCVQSAHLQSTIWYCGTKPE